MSREVEPSISQAEVKERWGCIWAGDYVFEPVDFKHDTISMLIFTAFERVGETSGLFLDVGSGPGSRTVSILKEFPLLRLVLLDQSQEALVKGKKYAARKNTPADFIRADVFNLPLPDNSVSCVFFNGLNEHFKGEERQQLFNEMVRVTKEGGSVVVITPNKLNPFHTLNKTLQEKRGTWIYGPQYDFTPRELITRMKAAGLKEVKQYGVGMYTSWIRLFPREKQRGLVISPTPISMVNRILHILDMEVDSKINKLLGREIMVVGWKPVSTHP